MSDNNLGLISPLPNLQANGTPLEEKSKPSSGRAAAPSNSSSAGNVLPGPEASQTSESNDTKVVKSHEPAEAGDRVPTKVPFSWTNLLSLSALDDIDAENVRNSMAFKLGALAGLLPALSVMSLTQFLSPEQLPASQGGTGDFTIGSACLVLLSSAMVGGSVAFFWAENRLRTIFTYGIAGPTVVLSIFLSGINNMAAERRVENVKVETGKKLEEETQKAQKEAIQQANLEVQKVLQSSVVETPEGTPPPKPGGSLPTAPPADAHLDLAKP